MFSRFNLKLENDIDSYIDLGEIEDNNEKNEEYIDSILEKYILDDGSIDGDGLQ